MCEICNSCQLTTHYEVNIGVFIMLAALDAC